MTDFRLTIDLLDVAEGDATTLADAIYDDHGADFDVQHGDFTIRVSRREGSGYFAVDYDRD